MRTLGMLFVIMGLAVLVNKGFTYPKTTTLIDTERVQMGFVHDKYVYVQPAVGVCGVIGGVLVLLLGQKTKEPS